MTKEGEELSTSDQDSPRTKILVGLTLIAVAVLVVTLTKSGQQAQDVKQNSETPTTQTASTSPLGGNHSVAKLEELERVTPEVQKVADGLKEPVEALREAAKKGYLPRRNLELPDALGAPRTAASFLPSLQGELAPNIGSFEWAMLAGVLLRAKGAEVVTYGYDSKSPSKSVLEHRVYAVKGSDGVWHAQDSALQDTERVTTMTRQEVQANGLAWMAMSAATSGNLDDASRSIGKALELAPQDPAIAFTEGRIQLASDLRERGWNTLDRVAGEQKTDAQAYVTIGELALGLKAPFRATRAFQNALNIDPNFPAALLGLAQVEMERLLVTPESEKTALRTTIESRLEKAGASAKKDADLWAVRADLAQLDKDEELRRKTLEEGVAANPSSLLAVLNMVQFHMEKRSMENAVAVGLRGHANGIRDPRLSTQLGVLHFELVGQALSEAGDEGLIGDSKRILEGALRHLEEAKTLAPEQQEIRLLLSQVHYLSGDETRGRSLLDEQATLFPRDTEGLLVSAQLAMKNSDFKLAKRKLDKVFTIDPKHRDAAAINYLMAILSDGDVAAARRKALKLGYPRQVLGQSVLEAIHVDPRGAQEVLMLMNDELADNPESIEAYNLKAVALTLLGKDTEAKEAIDQAVSMVPKENQENIREALNAQLAQAQLAVKARQMLQQQEEVPREGTLGDSANP